jgi:cholesterol transport system auxiliary component
MSLRTSITGEQLHVRRRSLRALLLGCCGLIVGCSTSSLLDSELPVPTSYVLAPLAPASAATESAASQVDLAISHPDAAPGLNTVRIAVMRGRELDYFRGVQWGGSTPDVVQALLVASLQDQKLFRSVTPEQTRVAGAYMLDVEVRDFQAEYREGREAPQAHITLLARLIRINDRTLVESLIATATRAANDNRMGEVAAAFEGAAQDVAQQLARATAAAVANDTQRVHPPAVIP